MQRDSLAKLFYDSARLRTLALRRYLSQWLPLFRLHPSRSAAASPGLSQLSPLSHPFPVQSLAARSLHAPQQVACLTADVLPLGYAIESTSAFVVTGDCRLRGLWEQQGPMFPGFR